MAGDLKMPLPASIYLLREGFGEATARRTKKGTGTKLSPSPVRAAMQQSSQNLARKPSAGGTQETDTREQV